MPHAVSQQNRFRRGLPMYHPHLKTFFTVIESGSFSKAASQLYLTPSAVLHQIRSLEKDLGAELFVRSSKGVTLTLAGSYLAQHGKPFIQMGDELRRGLHELVSKENSICIGSSMLEKCRLLYDLWVLFSAEVPDCRIQMVNIDVGQQIPESTDLIESINSSIPWMRNWQFLEVCQVPFGCAFVRDHPLAKKPFIMPEDLKGETVITINNGTCDTITELLKHLREAGADVVYQFGSGMNMFWESAFTRHVQLVPMCFHDILINMTVVPLHPCYSLPYGIFYRTNPSPPVRKFLDFIRLTYGEGNSSGILPVLS
jgi:DNA-binding transcriptional LysR family regulator